MSGGQERMDASISRPEKAKETRQGKVPRTKTNNLLHEEGKRKKEERREKRGGRQPLVRMSASSTSDVLSWRPTFLLLPSTEGFGAR